MMGNAAMAERVGQLVHKIEHVEQHKQVAGHFVQLLGPDEMAVLAQACKLGLEVKQAVLSEWACTWLEWAPIHLAQAVVVDAST